MFNAPEHVIAAEVTKYVKQLGGPDLRDVVGKLPCAQNVEEEWLEPTELAAELGITSGSKMNKLLRAMGLQKKANGKWLPTNKARGLFIKHAWMKGDKVKYNLKWNAREIERLIDKKLSA